MRATSKVDVVLFHHTDILLHKLFADGATALGMFVTIDSLDKNRRAVDAELLVFYLDSPKSYLTTSLLCNITIFIL